MFCNKQAHAETLKRIQEDRDAQKSRLGNTVPLQQTTSDAASSVTDVNDSTAASPVKRPPPSAADTSTLQVVIFHSCILC